MIVYKLPENNTIVRMNVVAPFNHDKVYPITSSIGVSATTGIVDNGFNAIVEHFSELINEPQTWTNRLNLYRRFCMTIDYYTVEN